ncbi:MAG TPA: arginase family protein [Symbiobacteriaceae bacterium]|nr:arginase family protein [Symbiobacteriaceae bacterium]
MAIQLLGFPTTLGLPRKAVRHAPQALRSAGLIEHLQRLVPVVEDLGDLPLPELHEPGPAEAMLQGVVQSARRQADFWLQHHRPGHLMLTLGGDHSTSLGTLWALARMGHAFDVVWIDAHGDFNIMETSPTGNAHGMVLALACGLMPAYMPAVVSPADVRLWGIRDLDPGERELLVRHRVEVLSPDETRHEWERVLMRLKPNVFLSFDIDSVDPTHAPGTMTPVTGGFCRYEALDMVARLARRRHILAMDLVELHPDRDQQNATVQLGIDLAAAAVSGQAERRQNGFSAAAGA